MPTDTRWIEQAVQDDRCSTLFAQEVRDRVTGLLVTLGLAILALETVLPGGKDACLCDDCLRKIISPPDNDPDAEFAGGPHVL